MAAKVRQINRAPARARRREKTAAEAAARAERGRRAGGKKGKLSKGMAGPVLEGHAAFLEWR